MDRRERSGQAVTALLAAFDGLQSALWTALPGIIQSFNAQKQTATILPALQMRQQNPDGSFTGITMPVLLDCPVLFIRGGGVSLTFPIKQGDECLVVFASRCIDNWWLKGSPGGTVAQEQAEFRMHDLSDGFCLPGLSSVPRVVADINVDRAELRTDDGLTRIAVNPDGSVLVEAEALLTVVAPVTHWLGDINVTGDVNITGTLTATEDVIADGISLKNHTHGGVISGGDFTDPPT